MKIRPLGDKVIVKPQDKEAEATKAGIILPDTVSKEKPEKGKVLAIGPGRLLENGVRITPAVKVGDVVLFKKYSPDEIKVDGEELLIISEQDILAVVEN